VQEADDRAARLETRCKQLELECQESKQKHAVSIKELDSYVTAHNMEKYQSKSRETEWKNKLSMLQAEHSRLKSDFANLEAAVDIKVQDEVGIWRSRVAQLEDQLRDVSRELKDLRS
jgi:predicted nuclease with TOPRIM domain